jgi:hypothetical protein
MPTFQTEIGPEQRGPQATRILDARAVYATQTDDKRRLRGKFVGGLGGEVRPDDPRSEGQVVVGGGGAGGGGVANGAPVAHERVVEGASAQADGVGEGDDGPLVAGSVEVVDEGHVLGHEGARGDVEGVLEQNDGGEFGRADEVG